jgi:hypothetical protein
VEVTDQGGLFRAPSTKGLTKGAGKRPAAPVAGQARLERVCQSASGQHVPSEGDGELWCVICGVQVLREVLPPLLDEDALIRLGSDFQ